MLTPQDIRERSKFEKAVFGGYSMAAVDDLMQPLVADYTALYKENTVLKSKMKVLTEKIEEYHQQEESMKRAILAAQVTADDLVAQAERKSTSMLTDMEQNLRERADGLTRELDAEAERVNRAKAAVSAYIVAIENKVQTQLQELESLKSMDLKPVTVGDLLPDDNYGSDSEVDMAHQIEDTLKDLMHTSPSAAQSGESDAANDTKVIPS